MKWMEELRITRRPLDEIGLATIVRECFGNNLSMTLDDANDTLGIGWDKKAEELRRAGILRYEIADRRVTMKVVAPGDRKRERCKKLNKRRKIHT